MEGRKEGSLATKIKDDSLTSACLLNLSQTLFYRYYGGEKIAGAINQVGFDAFTLGVRFLPPSFLFSLSAVWSPALC
jgi:hypothetical protein